MLLCSEKEDRRKSPFNAKHGRSASNYDDLKTELEKERKGGPFTKHTRAGSTIEDLKN